MFRKCLSAAAALVFVLTAGTAHAGSREEATLESSSDVLDALAGLQLKGIPPSLLHDAHGVAIIPDVIKAGFVIGGRHGHGVMLVREPTGAWGRPIFVSVTGGSVGWQIGIQATDLVLVFKTRNGVDRVLKGKSKITLGADLAIAAGPVGRQAEADTDARLKAEIYSYSRSRGLFAGVSLEGAALVVDQRTTDAYYNQRPPLIAAPTMPLTPPEVKLQLKLATLSGATPVIIGPPPMAPEPPPPPGPVLPAPRPYPPPPVP